MSVPGPVIGPCAAWITAADVLACCSAEVASSDDEAMLAERAVEASMLLWEVSGRQYGGLCGPVTVRPCRQSCGCWEAGSGRLGPFYWSPDPGGVWSWFSESCADSCGCGTTSYVRLAGYPVRKVLEVKIGGAVVDPSEYAIVRWRRLMRRRGSWPACQNVGLPDDQPGTFSVTYEWGVDPPPLGAAAAAQLACELYSACKGGACRLPSRVVQVVRQGVTIQRTTPLASYLLAGATGLELVDSFVAGYGGLRRRPAVWSPDVQPFARREAI